MTNANIECIVIFYHFYSNQVTSLFKHERIQTTFAKAQALRAIAEAMITLGKRGTAKSYSKACSFIQEPAMVRKCFTELAERYKYVFDRETFSRVPKEALESIRIPMNRIHSYICFIPSGSVPVVTLVFFVPSVVVTITLRWLILNLLIVKVSFVLLAVSVMSTLFVRVSFLLPFLPLRLLKTLPSPLPSLLPLLTMLPSSASTSFALFLIMSSIILSSLVNRSICLTSPEVLPELSRRRSRLVFRPTLLVPSKFPINIKKTNTNAVNEWRSRVSQLG